MARWLEQVLVIDVLHGANEADTVNNRTRQPVLVMQYLVEQAHLFEP